MQFNCKMGYSGNEQDYQLIKTSLSELKKYSNQKEVLRYLTNVLPNPTDMVALDNAQNTVKSVKAQLANKNLIPYPYTNTTKTENGITFTVNSDGSITVNGTATANTVFDLETNATMFTLPAGNYFLSGCPSGGDLTSYFMAATNAYDKFQRDFGSGIYVPSKGEKWKISIRIMSGYTADNLVFKPQIELGTTATAYTPYISDFTTVKVNSCGKNLIPFPYAETQSTINGVSVTYGEDGSIIFNGTAGNNVYFKVFDRLKFPAGKYYLSGIPTEGGPKVAFLYFFETDNPDKTYNAYTTNGVACSLSGTEYSGRIYIAKGQTVENLVFKPQLELGTTATEYEPYQSETYTPTATGEVTGITVLTPTTNITNDKGLLFTKVTGDDFNYIN